MQNEEEMWIRNQSNDSFTKEKQTQRAQNNNRTLEQLYCRQEIVQNATDSSQNKTKPAKTKHRKMFVNLLMFSNEVNLATEALHMVTSVKWYHSYAIWRPLKQQNKLRGNCYNFSET